MPYATILMRPWYPLDQAQPTECHKVALTTSLNIFKRYMPWRYSHCLGCYRCSKLEE